MISTPQDQYLAVCKELERLNHDIARHVQIATEQAQELEDLRTQLAQANERADSNYAAYKSAEADLAAARALLLKAVPLLKEVINIHSDPDDPNYNDCDKPMELCAWCYDAQAIIDAALAGQRREGEGE